MGRIWDLNPDPPSDLFNSLRAFDFDDTHTSVVLKVAATSAVVAMLLAGVPAFSNSAPRNMLKHPDRGPS